MRRTIVNATVATILLVGAPLAAAAVPLRLETTPVITRTEVLEPALIDVAVRPDGRHLVIWPESGFIMGAVYAADGTPLSGAKSVSGNARDSQVWRARAAALPDGRFVVAWMDERPPYQLRARVVDANGTPVGSPTLVGLAGAPYYAFGSTLSTELPALAADERGVVTVAWWNGFGIRVRRFEATGTGLLPLTWPAHGGSEALDLGQGAIPSLAVVPDGVVIAFETYATPQVAVVVLDRDGRQRGQTFYVSTILPAGLRYPNDVCSVRVTADASGRFLVVWREFGNDWGENGFLGKSDLIRGQRFAADGTPVGDVLDLVTGPSDLLDPDPRLVLGDVESRADGTWLLTWGIGRYHELCASNGFGEWCGRYDEEGDVHARVLAADGTLLAETLVAAGEPTRLPAAAAVTASGWLLTHLDPDPGAIDSARATFIACGDIAGALCLGNRFRLQVEWRTEVDAGEGTPLSVSADTGAFWFFSPSNVELVAKVLDGTGVNGKHWVFFASLTDVEFDLVVTDTATGAVKRYHNPQGTLASRADTNAFGDGGSLTAVASTMSSSSALGVALERAPAAVTAADTSSACPVGALCLAGGRFVVTAKWRLDASESAATPIGWTGETGTFWFFSPSNVELAVKVLDGRGVNGHFWVFYASLSDVEFDLEVLDTVTGARRTYHNAQGSMASRADVDAF